MHNAPTNVDEPGNDPAAIHETTASEAGLHRYTLTRYYRRGTDTFRVTVHRDHCLARSHAVAEVLTTTRTWTSVVSTAPSGWFQETSLWGEKGTAVNPDPGFTTLRRLADTLVRDAAHIVPA